MRECSYVFNLHLNRTLEFSNKQNQLSEDLPQNLLLICINLSLNFYISVYCTIFGIMITFFQNIQFNLEIFEFCCFTNQKTRLSQIK